MLELTRKVREYLDQMSLTSEPSEDGLFWFKYGSTVVMIRLFDHEDERGRSTFVRFVATLLTGIEMSPALMERVMHLNTEVLFGTFLLFPEDETLAFAATILGDKLDLEEFETALRYVARISDDYDDILQEFIGGKRAEDLLREG